MYLGPVYGSEEIAKQMPKERKEFAAADAKWRNIMQGVLRQPLVIQVWTHAYRHTHTHTHCTCYMFKVIDRRRNTHDRKARHLGLCACLCVYTCMCVCVCVCVCHMQVTDTEHLLDDLTKCNNSFHIIEKSLNAYLDSKKLLFPR